MLKNIFIAILQKLQEIKVDEVVLLQQVEGYEGQYENLENFVINPPAAFLAIRQGTNVKENYMELETGLELYLFTSHLASPTMKSASTDMLDVLETLIGELHGYIVMVDDAEVCRLQFESFERLDQFPGLAIFKLQFKADIFG